MATAVLSADHHLVAYVPTEEDVQDIHFGSNQSIPKAPRGFPTQLEGKLVWRGSEIASQHGAWMVDIGNQVDMSAIEAALAHFESLGVSPSLMDRDAFPLPQTLADRLDGVSEACYNGLGFAVLRGLDPERYSEEQNALIFAGLASYVASARAFQDQNREHVLCHVVDSGGSTPAFTGSPMPFHTDAGEILALYHLQAAKQGGATLLASAWQVYNDLAHVYPEALQALSEDWIFDTHKDYTLLPPYSRPVLYADGDKVMMQLSQYRLTGFGPRPRNPALPALSEQQVLALNAFELAAARSCMRLTTAPGEMLFINNLGLVHARESFHSPTVDTTNRGPEAGDAGRHVLKLFLRDSSRSWNVPQALQPTWDKLYGGNQPDGTRKEKWILDNSGGDSQKIEWASNG